MTCNIDNEYMVSIRRHLHAHPELSLEEYETAGFIEEQLDTLGIARQRVGPTGVLGVIEGEQGAGKTILLRADIDALPVTEATRVPYQSQNPGVMHACGHDLHTAALLGAAKALQSIRHTLSGRILLVFQPAEEYGHGSRFFQDKAALADRAFGIHVNPQLPVGRIGVCEGAVAAACDYFRIGITGKSAHITRPHQGIDALYIASSLATGLQSLTNRLLDPFETALVGIGKLQAGTAYNVIADAAVLEGSVRSFSDETQSLLKSAISAVAEETAGSHGAKATVSYESFTPALINRPADVREFMEVAAEAVGLKNIATGSQAGLGLGADDFAVFLKEAGRGIYAFVGTANEEDPHTRQALHSGSFDVDERALSIAARLHTAYALATLKETRGFTVSEHKEGPPCQKNCLPA